MLGVRVRDGVEVTLGLGLGLGFTVMVKVTVWVGDGVEARFSVMVS